MEVLKSYLIYLIPIFIIQLGLQLYAIVVLFRQDTTVRGGKKWIWLIVIVLLEILGPIVFFILGRTEGEGGES